MEIEKKIGYVYVITNLLDTNDKYIGSTTQTVQHRYKQHIGHAFDENSPKYNRKLYVQIRTVGKEFFEVSLLENVLYGNILELRKREQYFIDTLKPSLNNINAFIEDKDNYHHNYNQNNKERLAVMQKEYNIKNKEKIIVIQKEYYDNNKVIISEKKKQYYENNKELIKAKTREHKNKNKDLISAKARAKYVCPDCKRECFLRDRAKHEKTKIHIKSLIVI